MENLFSQFIGADLDRLMECIKAVKAAGLSIDKYTMAGVNDNSGNVWIADEGWRGCVYCSIGFDVQWSWSCGNCGEEYDFDSYADMEEFADKQEDATDFEGCEKCCEAKTEETEEA